MERLCGTAMINIKRVMAVVFATAITTTMFGCDGREVDPGFNLSGNMRVYPDTSAQEELQKQVGTKVADDDTGGAGGIDNPNGSTSGSTGTGADTVNNETYPAIDKNIVSFTSYSQYLESVVNQPVIKTLSNKGYKNLYYSICFYGYEPATDGTMKSSSATYNDVLVGSNVGQTSSYLSGVMLPKLAKAYLTNVGSNTDTLSRAYKNWKVILEQCGVSTKSTWANAHADSTFCTKFPQILNMWGNTRLYGANTSIAGTFGEYKTASSKGEVIGIVPNISLQMLTGYKTYSTITLNPTTGLGTSAYYDRLSYTDAQKLFISYNQESRRDLPRVTINGSDSKSIVHAEIDGYNRCIVALACLPGTTLKAELGESNLNAVTKAISGFACYDEPDVVRSIIADAVIITKGTRGVN